MTTKLFVGNLAYSMTSDDLRAAFAKVGDVLDANVVMDKQTGRSRGFGFVEMKSEEDAKKAMDTLNGTEVDGRKIFVSEAKQKEENRNQE
ncbi:MAG: RNA-binding protein [Patescibacteria group bacterium]